MKVLSIISLSLIVLISCGQSGRKEINKQTHKPELISPQENLTDTLFNFEKYEPGIAPKNWTQYYTGRGESTEWKILQEDGNSALTQVSNDHPNFHFNVIIHNSLVAKNVDLQVKLKGLSGEMDQGGGFVWRFIDANNYYVVRANPLEDNVVMYKVKNGKRTDLPVIGKGRSYGVDVKPLGSGWNTLRLVAQNDIFTVFLNNEEIFKVKDKTFTSAGKLGLWTKADAVTAFDDFKIVIK